MNDRLASAILTTKNRDNDSHVKTRHIRKLPKSEAALEFRYRAMLEQIPAIIYTDSVGEFSRTVYINPQVESITGYTPKQWLTDRELWFKIIHKEDQDRVWSESIRTAETGEPYKVEYRIRTCDGQTKWIYSEAWLLHDATDKPLFWQGFMIDITERKQAEMELEHRAAELSALQETVLNLTMRHSLPDLLNLIVERATKLLYANGGGLYLVDREAETIKCVVSYNTHNNYAGTVLCYGE
jgi:PAS domain S-box-containing protein